MTRPPLIIEVSGGTGKPRPEPPAPPRVAPQPFRPPWNMTPDQWDVFCAITDREEAAQVTATTLDEELALDATGTLRCAAAAMRESKHWTTPSSGIRSGAVFRIGRALPRMVFTGQLVSGEINT